MLNQKQNPFECLSPLNVSLTLETMSLEFVLFFYRKLIPKQEEDTR